MDLATGARLELKPASWLEPFTEFQMPKGTITVIIDQKKGIMDIYAQHDVHPFDWDCVVGLLSRMAVPDIGEPSYLKGIDTWHIQLRSPS
jgi:hypothetical protein